MNSKRKREREREKKAPLLKDNWQKWLGNEDDGELEGENSQRNVLPDTKYIILVSKRKLTRMEEIECMVGKSAAELASEHKVYNFAV